MELYGQYYETMNSNYGSIHFWPQPYPYAAWYQQQTPEYQAYSMHPAQYSVFYEYAVTRYAQEMHAKQPSKPSRSQKRRLKKKQMEQELARQKQAIGDWVRLERKDLIQGLSKIEQQESKAKQKKKEKLSHLIEIHKEVYKHYTKRDSVVQPRKRRVKTENKKKRLSYIKKMKLAYQKKQGSVGLKGEKDWESDSDEEKAENTLQVPQTPVKAELQPPIKEIEYNELGKLTGVSYQNTRLREWVRNYPNEELQDIALRFVNRIAYKQAINRVKRPQKAKKLIVSGIKECKRTLRTIIDKKKGRILVVALNIERNNLQKGVDDEVQTILGLAQQIHIPVIHISTRARLGRAFTGKFGPRVTMVSVINFEGYQDMGEELLAKWRQSCSDYDAL